MSDRRELVLTAPLGRALWSLSWPMAISNQLSNLTLGVCLVWFGHLVGETGLVVESLFRPMGLLVSWFLGATSVGASVLVSRSVGANDGKGLSIAASSVTLTLAMSAVVVVVIAPMSPWLAGALAGELAVETPMLHYILGWLFVATPAFALGGVLLDIVSATGATAYNLARVIIDLVFMAAMAPILIELAGMGIAGGPTSEGVAALALCPVLWLALVRRRKEFALGELERGAFRIRWDLWRQLLAIGLPVQVGRFAYFIAQLVLLRIISDDGAASVAGFGVATMLLLLGAGTTLAVAEAGAIFVGQCLGAGLHERARRGVRATLLAGAIVMTVFVFVTTVFDRQIVGLFTSDAAIVAAAGRALSILPWAAFGIAAWQILVQAFAAYGATVRASVFMIGGEVLGVGVALAWPGTGLDAACVGMVAANLVKGALMLWLLVAGKVKPTTVDVS